MMYRLIFLNTAAKGRRITVDMAPMILGRDPECTIRLDDDEVSRKHAILEHKEEGLFIRDLGSMNRILVNNREVRDKRLKHGDLIELGRTQLLVQAIVQADVTDEEKPVSRNRELGLTAAIFMLLLALSMAAGYLFWKKASASTHFFSPENAVSNAVPSAILPSGGVPVAARSTAGAKAVTEEIRYLRNALGDIRETVDQLAQKQAAARAAAAPATNTPPVDEGLHAAQALKLKAETMLEEARKKESAGALEEADEILSGIQVLLPDYLPAYEERAKLFEKRGLLEKAIGQWMRLLQQNPDTNLFEKAVSEQARLGQAESLLNIHEPRDIEIAGVESHKFRASDDFAEMRILNIHLAAVAPYPAPEASAVRVDVVFYDEQKSSGRIAPTTAVVPADSLRIETPWENGERKTVTATYVAPRNAGPDAMDRDAHYYGYTVKVYYKDKLQDQEARPRSLLSPGETSPSTKAAP